jgi:murein DD-endopeptidase MepM/ murein hydrolase activator NlpD
VFDDSAYTKQMVSVDLSVENADRLGLDPADSNSLRNFVSSEISSRKGTWGFGGYKERRIWYRRNESFMEPGNERDIHMAIDVWMPEGTPVRSPLPATVHSFQDNAAVGDYGPTIILAHDINGCIFHSLYGHLSRECLSAIQVGQTIRAGEAFATIGSEAVNGNWPAHLHCQLVIEMGSLRGDYPGVVSSKNLAMMELNCPDPTALLSLERY